MSQCYFLLVTVLVIWAATAFTFAWMPSNVGRLRPCSSFEHRSLLNHREIRRSSTKAHSSTPSQPTWNSTDVRSLPYDSALQALQAYHEASGDLAIPRSFVVPATEEYPVAWHGVKLARYVYNMQWWSKHISQNTGRVSELNRLGFIWDRLQPSWNLFMEGMVNYHNIHGNALVPASFVVPRHDEQWPQACWDLPLGSIVQRVRLRNDFLRGDHMFHRKQQLDGLGFVWDPSEDKFVVLLRALRHYDRVERHASSSRELVVPSKFVVPAGRAHGWPPELWGYPLGDKCTAVRQKQVYVKNHPHRKQALEDIGFRWSGNTKLGWLDVCQAAAIYSQMHGRVLNVPFNFVVPTPPCDGDSHPQCVDSWPWPERLWGLKLGQRLKDVRLKGAYLKGPDAHVRKAQLDNLGFVWYPPRGRRRRHRS